MRLNFSPEDRIEVSAKYLWPMIEGFENLVRVRKRQDDGVAQIAQLYPELLENDDKASLGKTELFSLLLKDPVGFFVYAAVHFAVKRQASSDDWTRGR